MFPRGRVVRFCLCPSVFRKNISDYQILCKYCRWISYPYIKIYSRFQARSVLNRMKLISANKRSFKRARLSVTSSSLYWIVKLWRECPHPFWWLMHLFKLTPIWGYESFEYTSDFYGYSRLCLNLPGGYYRYKDFLRKHFIIYCN